MIEYPATERIGAIEDQLEALAKRVRPTDPDTAFELRLIAVRLFAVGLTVVELEISARPVRRRENRLRRISDAIEDISSRVTTTGRNGS